MLQRTDHVKIEKIVMKVVFESPNKLEQYISGIIKNQQ